MDGNPTHSLIQNSEQRYRHLFENIPICLFVVNLTTTPITILEVNHRAELFYGYTASELVGNPITLLVPEESRGSVQSIIERVRRGETTTAEVMNRRRDGTIFPVRAIATLDPTNPGQMITTIEDIKAQWQRRTDTEAIEAERLRIAHEIHDGVAQNLAGLRFKSAQWHHLANMAPPEMHAALDEMQFVLVNAIEDIRRAIFALRPLDMESHGFFPAITNWVADFGNENQLAVQMEISGAIDSLPAAYELPLFRVIQEGLNNIRQHAQASTAKVWLVVDGTGGVDLSLVDNGRGFDPDLPDATRKSRHFGLRQMRERILDLGGTLDIRTASGQGTELLICLPRITREINDLRNGVT